MPDVFISRIGIALGSIESTLEQSAAAGLTLTSVEQLRAAGFARHHRAAPEESALDLALLATKQTGAGPQTDVIVYGTCLPQNASIAPASDFASSRDVKHLMDFPASHLQSRLGMEDASVIGLTQQGCTNAVGGIRLARALLVAEPSVAEVLCVTSDRFPEGATYEQAYNLISDGAAACVATKYEGEFRVLASHQLTNGGLVQATDEETVGMYFTYTHRLITEIVEKAGKQLTDVDWFVPQNTNRAAWDVMRSILGVDREGVWFPTLADVGHVISADCFVNLRALIDAGRLQSGALVLLVMAGYGMNWQAVLLQAS